jgi:hypothetical protein
MKEVNMPVIINISILTIACLYHAAALHAGEVALQVYKGELRILTPGQEHESLLIRYRSKNREVMRIGIAELELTNTTTREVTRLRDQSAGLGNRIDPEGYWIIDLRYDGFRLTADNYRVSGRLTQYLAGSQRSREFSVYLQPETASKPADSSIDWGIDN